MTNIYNKSETNNLLNTKQDTLTAATALLGTGGSITGINLILLLINQHIHHLYRFKCKRSIIDFFKSNNKNY